MQPGFVNYMPAAMPSGPPANFANYAAVKGPMPSADVFAPKAHGSFRAKIKLPLVLFSTGAPWCVFTVLSAAKSFSLNFNFPELTWMLLMCGFFPAVASACLAANAVRKGNDPLWYVFATLAFVLSVFAAETFGEINFVHNMKPFYNVQHLTTYPSVNVARDKGAQLMDAGAVYFADGTGLDMRRAMGFKSKELYCVAPIVFGEGKMASYDFWAIGKNCCSGVSSDFRCGEYNNPQASAGLRLLQDDERPFYRLAVQQAEAAYGVRATHPIFFEWMQDPVAEASSWKENGYRQYLDGVFLYFGVSCFLTMCACIIFATLGHLVH